MPNQFSNHFTEQLGSSLKYLRKKSRLTQERLAELAQIDYKHIQALESLKKIKDPRISTFYKLSKAFQVPLSSLIASIFEEEAIKKDDKKIPK